MHAIAVQMQKTILFILLSELKFDELFSEYIASLFFLSAMHIFFTGVPNSWTELYHPVAKQRGATPRTRVTI